jgi:hypothetical protein
MSAIREYYVNNHGITLVSGFWDCRQDCSGPLYRAAIADSSRLTIWALRVILVRVSLAWRVREWAW